MKHTLLLTLIVLLAVPTFALKNHPYDEAALKRIDKYSITNGKVSHKKLKNYLKRLNQKINEVVKLENSVLKSKYRRKKSRSEAKVNKKANKHKYFRALNLAKDYINEALNTNDPGTARRLVGMAIRLENAIKFETDDLGSLRILGFVKEVFKDWEINKKATANQEASNLYDPDSRQFLDVKDLQKLKKQGVDISKFNPSPNSTFWRDPGKIADIDIKKRAWGQGQPFYADIKVGFAKNKTYYFDKVKKSQTKPKIMVFTKNEDGKVDVEYKMKFGSEMHAEPTTTALMSAVGFMTDVSKYERNVKMYLEDSQLADIIQEWESYYIRDAISPLQFKIENYIVEKGEDDNGKYVVFSEVALEARPDKQKRIGPWIFEEYQSFRDVRALNLMNVWFENTDMKTADNNRLFLKKNSKAVGGYDIFQVLTDPGGSFSHIIPYPSENPEIFPMDIVLKNNSRRIKLNYFTVIENPMGKRITYADAKWFTRLIAQLTRQQIEQAVELGGWPACVQNILVDKLINRRNQLVYHLDLSNEFKLLELSKDWDKKAINACTTKKEIKENYSTNMDFNWDLYLGPIKKLSWDGLLASVRAGINGFNRFSISPLELGFERSYVAQIIVDYNREIELNPHPESYDDRWLVKDSLEIGYRLGYSFGVFADRMISRKFTLVYPVRTESQGLLNRGFVVDALLPVNIAKKKLPKKYVLSTEHYADFRIGARAYTDKTVGVGGEISHARGKIFSSIVDHKSKYKVYVLREKGTQNENKIQAFLKVLEVVKIPVFELATNWGNTKGVGYVLNKDKLFNDKKLSKHLYSAFVSGDFVGLDSLPDNLHFKRQYKSKSNQWNAILYSHTSNSKTDKLQVLETVGNTTNATQYKAHKKSGWSFVDNGEYREQHIGVYLTEGSDNAYSIELEAKLILEDKRTTDKEMQNVYLPFLNGVSKIGVPLIPLTPSLDYSQTGIWGFTMPYIKLELYKEAIGKLASVSKAQLWASMAEAHNAPLAEFKKGFANYKAWRKNRIGSRGKRIRPIKYNLKHKDVKLYSKVTKFLNMMDDFLETKDFQLKVKKLAKLINNATYKTRNNGRDSRLLGGVLALLNKTDFFLEVGVELPPTHDVAFLGGVKPLATRGQSRKLEHKYLIFEDDQPSDLYFMSDNWFKE